MFAWLILNDNAWVFRCLQTTMNNKKSYEWIIVKNFFHIMHLTGASIVQVALL